MLEGIKAVLFDLDGTLVDSMWMWEAIDIEYLGSRGISLPEGLQNRIEGMSFSETAAYFKETFQLTDTTEQIKAEWNRMAWEKYKHEVPLKEGAMEFLACLKRHHIKTGIATSNSRELAQLVIGQLGITRYLDAVHTSCEVSKGKPSPDIYLLSAADLKIRPSECLVFEDILPGIEAGRNAGMRVCAVYDAYSADTDHEKRMAADYYIRSFKEIRVPEYADRSMG